MLAFFAVSISITSCGEEHEEPKHIAELDTLVQAVPKLNIGGKQDEYVFGRRIFLHVGKDDKLYITDNQRGSISIFRKNGDKIKRAELAGRGPGEFQAMNVQKNYETGHLGIYDEIEQRFTVYDARIEEVITSVRIDIPDDLYIILLGFDDDAVYFSGFKGFNLSNYDESRNLHYLRAFLDSQNITLETIKTFPSTEHVVKADRSDGYIHLAEKPFGKRTKLHHHNDHIYHTSNNAVGYTKFHTTSDRQDSLFLDFNRVKVTDDMFDAYLNHHYDQVGSDEFLGRLVDYIRDEELIPEKAMHYNDSFVDSEGRLWFEIHRELTPDKSKWAVLDPESEEIFLTMFPVESFTPINADRQNIYGIEINDSGAETVSIFEF